MFRHGEISTETDKKPFFFALAAFAVCLTAAVLLFVLGDGGLAVFAGIMMSIVALAAGAVLFAMVTDSAYIREDALVMTYLFKKEALPISEIGRISFKEDIYSVYDRSGRLAGTINAKLTGIGELLHALDLKGVPFV